jgi:hypothetical protein
VSVKSVALVASKRLLFLSSGARVMLKSPITNQGLMQSGARSASSAKNVGRSAASQGAQTLVTAMAEHLPLR